MTTDIDNQQERESFEACFRNHHFDGYAHGIAWDAWQARAALDTGGRDDIILRMRERIASVREDHRRKMNAASDRAEMAASVGDMKEVSINSTESERYREAFVALNVAVDIIDSTELPAAAPQPSAYASEPLGRFGHHSDPAIDFCVEVEEIEGEAENLRIGFEKGTPARDDLAKRIGLALEFRVGGDEGAVRAKNRLREIEAKFRASTSASAGKEPVAWVNKSYLDSIIEHSGKVYWHAPMMCGTWFAGAFPIYTAPQPPASACSGKVEPVACIACEGHPQAPNEPCAVCGKSGDTQPVAVAWMADAGKRSTWTLHKSKHDAFLASEACGGSIRPLYTAPPSHSDARQAAEELVTWAVERWRAEVLHRPLVNVNRRPLDDCWRQVIRHFGGDPDVLIGPAHDDLVAALPSPKGNDFLEPAPDARQAAEARRHAVELEQCAIFVAADTSEHLAKAMTDAAAFLRALPGDKEG